VSRGGCPALALFHWGSPPLLRVISLPCVGFLINISTFLQIKWTSPLTHNISGTAKACVQTIMGVLIWQNDVSFLGMFGTFLSIIGCFLYGYVRYLGATRSDRPHVAFLTTVLANLRAEMPTEKAPPPPKPARCVRVVRGALPGTSVTRFVRSEEMTPANKV
jgi:hypothetical protein